MLFLSFSCYFLAVTVWRPPEKDQIQYHDRAYGYRMKHYELLDFMLSLFGW